MESALIPAVTYRKVQPQNISKSLDSLFAELGSAEKFQRSESRNIVILKSSDDLVQDEPETEALLQLYAKILPGRVFYLDLLKQSAPWEVRIGACCKPIGGEKSICTEVIRLSGGESDFAMAASIIRAHLLTAVPVDLLLLSPEIPSAVVSRSLEVCDRIAFDSRRFGQHLHLLSKISESEKTIVDLNWIRLGPWRQQIKQAFDKGGLSAHLEQLSSVQLSFCSNQGCNADALLLAGWIMDRLCLEVESIGRDGFRLVSERGNVVLLNLQDDSNEPGVESIQLLLGKSAGQEQSVKVHRECSQGMLQCEIHLDQPFHVSIPLQSENWIQTLGRYHSVGDSTEHYIRALHRFIELHNLRLGFTGTEPFR